MLARATSAGSAALDLAGRHVVVSAGGTREYLDPVRFLGNRSSGLQGYALARAAAARGAEVTLVAANVTLPDPAGVKVVRVETTAQLRQEVLAAASSADAVVMAAAPADFRPVDVSDAKIKKAADGSAPSIELAQNPDILHEISTDRARPGSVVVGFAAETGDDTGSVLDLARAKLARKGCDLLVVNDVSGGAVFGSPDNEAVILARRRRDRRGAPRLEDRPGPRHLGRSAAGSGLTGLRPPSAISGRRLLCVRRPQSMSEQGVTAVTGRLFTSESVTEGHPDKIADQISDSVLDAMLEQDPHSRVAVETLLTTGLVVVAGEVTTTGYVDIKQKVRDRILEIGYDSSAQGLRRRLLRRDGRDRRPVRRHRPGRRHRPREPHRLRGRDGQAGRRRPGPDVRLRLRRHRRADAAARS